VGRLGNVYALPASLQCLCFVQCSALFGKRICPTTLLRKGSSHARDCKQYVGIRVRSIRTAVSRLGHFPEGDRGVPELSLGHFKIVPPHQDNINIMRCGLGGDIAGRRRPGDRGTPQPAWAWLHTGLPVPSANRLVTYARLSPIIKEVRQELTTRKE
jgi:hypothetical protein